MVGSCAIIPRDNASAQIAKERRFISGLLVQEFVGLIDDGGEVADGFAAVGENCVHRDDGGGEILTVFVFGADHVYEKVGERGGEGFGFGGARGAGVFVPEGEFFDRHFGGFVEIFAGGGGELAEDVFAQAKPGVGAGGVVVAPKTAWSGGCLQGLSSG